MPTHAATMKAAIESVLEGRITADIERYTIDGREITKIPMQELIELHKHYTAIVQNEQNTADVAAGLGNKRTIKVRF
jgi:hypothetical protein